MPQPQPNLAARAFLELNQQLILPLLVIVRDWYNSLAPDQKYLFAGLKTGSEVWIGTNFYYYPNGNSYLNRPPSQDPPVCYHLSLTHDLRVRAERDACTQTQADVQCSKAMSRLSDCLTLSVRRPVQYDAARLLCRFDILWHQLGAHHFATTGRHRTELPRTSQLPRSRGNFIVRLFCF